MHLLATAWSPLTLSRSIYQHQLRNWLVCQRPLDAAAGASAGASASATAASSYQSMVAL